MLGHRFLVSRRTLAEISRVEQIVKDLDNNSLLGLLGLREAVEWSNDHWVLWRVGDPPPAQYDFQQFAEENPDGHPEKWPGILAEWYFRDDPPEFEQSPIAQAWEKLLGSPTIPYDLKERERKFKDAFNELDSYIQAHRELGDIGRR
jgi:hypothetical protein